ncbi:putative cyclic pyranopterin monophosphate synthase, partial [Frankliniella fusca]
SFLLQYHRGIPVEDHSDTSLGSYQCDRKPLPASGAGGCFPVGPDHIQVRAGTTLICGWLPASLGRVTGAAIERWDFHLLLYKADMGPFVSLWRKILPVPGHLIAGTPLKCRSVHHQRTVHQVRGDVQSHFVAAVSQTIPGRGLGHGLDGLLYVTGDGRARGGPAAPTSRR